MLWASYLLVAFTRRVFVSGIWCFFKFITNAIVLVALRLARVRRALSLAGQTDCSTADDAADA